MGHVYVLSDIHGNYEKYIKALDMICLNDDDVLFVLGDVMDRGKNPLKILLDMMCRFNVIPILGNHEFMATTVLKVLAKEITDDNLVEFDEEFVLAMNCWLADGGQTTLDEFYSLAQDEREDILEYLEEFQLYAEVSTGGNVYVLVHAGISNFDPNKNLNNYKMHDLIFRRADYDRVYFEDKILVTGHTPTILIWGKDEIYKNKNHIAIDCGCGFARKLAVICLDDGREFYI
jgi:serine/threonine protein phosphatase 1